MSRIVVAYPENHLDAAAAPDIRPATDHSWAAEYCDPICVGGQFYLALVVEMRRPVEEDVMSQVLSIKPEHRAVAPETFVRTETGAKLHIAACPHLGSAFREATAAERLAMNVCTWCQAELDGVGRTYCETVEEAMRLFGTHAGTEMPIKSALRSVRYDQIWVPNSRSYVALGRDGHGVAWFGKTYVVPAVGEFLELPDYNAGRGGGTPSDKQVGETCPVHFLTRSLTGVCELCD